MRFLTILLFLLSFSAPAHANCTGPDAFAALTQAEQDALRTKAAQAPYSEGLLWRVEKDGVVSHIIGTFHVHLPEHAQMVTRLSTLTPQPEAVFLELTAADQLGFQQHLMNNPDVYLIQSGGSLIDRLGPELWAQVSDQLKARGMPAFMAARYKPWFLGMTLMLPPCAFDIVKSGKKGLDAQIEVMADENGMSTHSLDTTEALLQILAGDPLEDQLDDLKWSLSLSGDMAAPDQIPAVINMYLNETVQLVWEFSQSETLKGVAGDVDAAKVATLLQEVEEQLIVARNTGWIETLVPALTDTPSLVAVGALHLPGTQGVLAQLEAAGFTITRVPLSAQ